MGIRSGADGSRGPLAVLAACLLWTALAGAAPLAGRSVQDALRELAGPGLNLIFSSDVVPADLKVLAEPASPAGIAAVREILAAHGLLLVGVGDGAWAVTRA
ncbi:MAG: hypothetical protein IT484_03395, partial [Gammaproteobacteria bacterium]|nr:hypothetical protein [Gammaproteobacteria bacterium]